MINADESLTESDPALAELAVASTLGRVPAGPALRKREPIRLRPGRDLEHTKGLCATAHGFSLHAATTARAEDAAGREALCKYILRPPIARENVELVADDLVRLKLKRPFSDGTFALDLDHHGSVHPTVRAGNAVDGNELRKNDVRAREARLEAPSSSTWPCSSE